METDDELSLRVLRALHSDPTLTQRAMAAKAEVSLGAINYCLRALREKGLIKVRNFRASNQKYRYAYVLTPVGLAAKLALTRRFLDRKLHEYAVLRQEIEDMRRELAPPEPDRPVPEAAQPALLPQDHARP